MLLDFNLINQTFGTMIRGYYKSPVGTKYL
jgi:hypothetical protein